MKRKIVIALILMLGSTTFMSCEKTKNNASQIDETKYLEFAAILKNDLAIIGQSLRDKNGTFNSQDIILTTAKKHFSDKPKTLDAFLIQYNKSSNNIQLKNTENNEIINSFIREIEIGLINSKGANEFTDFLQVKFDEILNDDIQFENKDYLLQYIISYKVSVEFLNNNLDLINLDEQQLKSIQYSWWDSWGQCAAGILGGAGMGALGGAAAASVIPILGTIAGAIAGGIFGGLSGAAAAC